MARVGVNPWTWSDELVLFNPNLEEGWGSYMHKRGEDTLKALSLPRNPSLPGYAYAPFLLERFTIWNASTRHLLLTYLMATFVPYQVMLIQATLQLS